MRRTTETCQRHSCSWQRPSLKSTSVSWLDRFSGHSRSNWLRAWRRLTATASSTSHVEPASWLVSRASSLDRTRGLSASMSPRRCWPSHVTVLTCHQGLQFISDKPAAIREMHRVLAPGGRVAIATWCFLDDIPGMLELNAVVERHVGRIVDSRHSFGDANALKRLLVEAGFTDVQVGTLAHDVRFADGGLFARLNAMAAIGMSDKGKAMSEPERGELAGQIAAESQDAIAKATKNGMFVLPLTTVFALGHV